MEEHEKHRPEHAFVEPMFAALLEPPAEDKTPARRARLALLLFAAVAAFAALAILLAA
jgi:hypothetical protein